MNVARTKPRRSAVALLEAMIVLTVFLTLVVGMVEMGLGVFRFNLVPEAARQGARQAMVHGEYSSSPWGPATVGPIKGNDSHPLAQAIMPFLVGIDPETVTIQCQWLDDDNQVDHRVQVTVTVVQTFVFLAQLGVQPLTLSSQTTMQIAH